MDRLASPAGLRAPQKSGEVLVAPGWELAGDLIVANRSVRDAWDYDVQGVPLASLAHAARAEILDAAAKYTHSYAADLLGQTGPFEAAGPIVLAGHQPELFHPGVWLKNFAIGRLAERFSGAAVNLIIDADDVRTTDIRVPAGTPAAPRFESVPYDLPLAPRPYEERPIRDRATFDSFAARAMQHLAPLVDSPLLPEFWPLVRERSRGGNLGQALAQARHLVELEWGNRTLELPQSALCRLPAIRTLFCHFLAHLPRLHDLYNAALDNFRGRHHIRNHAQPMPNLEDRDGWLEAPLWVWSADEPRRRRLFARSNDAGVELCDLGGWRTVLPLSPEGECGAAAVCLAELERSGVKLRSRALITTLVARLLGSDLFVHGIGGARYDEVTDELIREFFGCDPPRFMAVSGTLHLPIEAGFDASQGIQNWKQRLRDLTYHPERHLDEIDSISDPSPRCVARPESSTGAFTKDARDARSLAQEKRQWIRVAKTPENARARHEALARANEQLREHIRPLRDEAVAGLEDARQAERARQILRSREYAFCLYPSAALERLLFSL